MTLEQRITALAQSIGADTKLIPRRVKLPADVAAPSGANALGDVTGLSFPVESGKTYRFYFFIVYTAAATTTGSRWSIGGPAFSALHYMSEYALTATSKTVNAAMTAYNLPAAANASSASTGSNIAIIEGVVTPSASGNVTARFASEVAASAITAKGGLSYVEYAQI